MSQKKSAERDCRLVAHPSDQGAGCAAASATGHQEGGAGAHAPTVSSNASNSSSLSVS